MSQSGRALLLFFLTLLALSISTQAVKGQVKKNAPPARADGFIALSLATGELGKQTNLGFGLQLRGFRVLDQSTTGSSLAIGLLGSIQSLGPNEKDLSSFSLITIAPELILLLPSPSKVTPYLSTSIGLGIIHRADDKKENEVDYAFSESVPMGSIGFGIRMPGNRFAMLTELRYRNFSSKQMGSAGLLSLNLGVGF